MGFLPVSLRTTLQIEALYKRWRLVQDRERNHSWRSFLILSEAYDILTERTAMKNEGTARPS
jgi:hypothetical protein